MNILVVGFGHFAGVVASCLAQEGHYVTQRDEVPWLLREGQRAADSEPGYIQPKLPAFFPPHFVWIAYDCPLDAGGLPVTDEILRRIHRLDADLPLDVPFIVSCQWPVGTFAKVEGSIPRRRPWFYVMENVRVGHAIKDFSRLAVVLGARYGVPDNVRQLFALRELIVMSPESAEMAKHTTNAFMALQIAFINEIAALSEHVGANPQDVAEALRSDWRVGTDAPLKPGGPFGGGSLLRDLRVLHQLWQSAGYAFPLLESIELSNQVRAKMVPA